MYHSVGIACRSMFIWSFLTQASLLYAWRFRCFISCPAASSPQ